MFNLNLFLKALRDDLQPVAIAAAAIESLNAGASGPEKQQAALNLLGAGLIFTNSINPGAANNAALIATAAIPLIQETVGLFNALHLFHHAAVPPVHTPGA